MDFPSLAALPPSAIAAFVFALAVTVAVDRFGMRKGTTLLPLQAGPHRSLRSLLTPTALNHATAAAERPDHRCNGKLRHRPRQHVRATDRLAEQVEHLGDGTDRLRDEVIPSASKMK
ncbi:hypothetical protein ABIB57_004445 [Devosia sp. UYZn731]|uniref:hypothetical protein n=1 Tax=Devosia sp. UYZn731 TaxID=3156345 RepID=UPI00339B1D5D